MSLSKIRDPHTVTVQPVLRAGARIPEDGHPKGPQALSTVSTEFGPRSINKGPVMPEHPFHFIPAREIKIQLECKIPHSWLCHSVRPTEVVRSSTHSGRLASIVCTAVRACVRVFGAPLWYCTSLLTRRPPPLASDSTKAKGRGKGSTRSVGAQVCGLGLGLGLGLG